MKGSKFCWIRCYGSCPKVRVIFPKIRSRTSPSRFMAAEIIREQVLVETKEEVPYATTV